MKGRLLDAAPAPGSAEWLTRMSASKIAAVVGLSPFESAFSLWHRMAGIIPQPEQNAQMSRGHYLEAGVCQWFADQANEFDLLRGQSFLHETRDWQVAAPDRLLARKDDADVTSLLEVKTAAYSDEWGANCTDAIPPYYRAQVLWQLDTLGLQTAHVAVLLGQGLEFRRYVIEYDAKEADYLVDAGRRFMDSLPNGAFPSRPSIDEHDATYQAVRAMHPEIDGSDIEISADLWHAYSDTKHDLEAAKDRHQTAKSELLDAMGDARRALVGDTPVLRRQPAARGAVALYPINQKDAA